MEDGQSPKYRRILLKLSGEALIGPKSFGIDHEIIESISRQIQDVKELGVEIAIVVGGGNIFRGLEVSKTGFDRVAADNMGMLATVINALALQDNLERLGIQTRVMSAVTIESFCEPYIRRRAIRHMEKGRVVILAAGTGNPYFSTDTAAALRAKEVHADVLIKATNVDGVYTADPKTDPEARFLPRIKYMDVLKNELRVMDLTAIALCSDNHIPVIVFNLGIAGNLRKVILGAEIGSIVQY
jgi:uridylate kinase